MPMIDENFDDIEVPDLWANKGEEKSTKKSKERFWKKKKKGDREYEEI